MMFYALSAIILCFPLGNLLSIDNDQPVIKFERPLEIDIKHWSDIAGLENLGKTLGLQSGSLDININEIVDIILDNLRTIIIKSGLDPYELADRVIDFNYKYQTKVLLLTYTGNVQGSISDIKIGIEFTYNTCDNLISIDNFRLRDSGKFSVIFTGSGIFDWVINAMTSAITTVLHPALIRIVESFVKIVAQQVINAINDFLNS